MLRHILAKRFYRGIAWFAISLVVILLAFAIALKRDIDKNMTRSLERQVQKNAPALQKPLKDAIDKSQHNHSSQ